MTRRSSAIARSAVMPSMRCSTLSCGFDSTTAPSTMRRRSKVGMANTVLGADAEAAGAAWRSRSSGTCSTGCVSVSSVSCGVAEPQAGERHAGVDAANRDTHAAVAGIGPIQHHVLQRDLRCRPQRDPRGALHADPQSGVAGELALHRRGHPAGRNAVVSSTAAPISPSRATPPNSFRGFIASSRSASATPVSRRRSLAAPERQPFRRVGVRRRRLGAR